MPLVYEFKDFPKEQELVGDMLLAYGQLEFDVARLIGFALPSGDDMAGRLLFRVNGEAARLDVADAILRPFFETVGISGQWGNALGALRYCKNVRNQYAHCQWHIPDRQPPELCFINLDRDADSPDGTLHVQLYPTDLRLLKKQHEYFNYTILWLYCLTCACQRRAGQEVHVPSVPKSIPQPPLHNLPKNPPALPKGETTPIGRPEKP
jgi:hypothetical protein